MNYANDPETGFMKGLAGLETIILESVFIAITENSNVTVDDALSKRLDQLSLTIRSNPHSKFDSKIKPHYEKCKDRLKLSLVFEVNEKGERATGITGATMAIRARKAAKK